MYLNINCITYLQAPIILAKSAGVNVRVSKDPANGAEKMECVVLLKRVGLTPATDVMGPLVDRPDMNVLNDQVRLIYQEECIGKHIIRATYCIILTSVI